MYNFVPSVHLPSDDLNLGSRMFIMLAVVGSLCRHFDRTKYHRTEPVSCGTVHGDLVRPAGVAEPRHGFKTPALVAQPCVSPSAPLTAVRSSSALYPTGCKPPPTLVMIFFDSSLKAVRVVPLPHSATAILWCGSPEWGRRVLDSMRERSQGDLPIARGAGGPPLSCA